MNTIIKSIFGSHLYGTDTPNSDIDYKGIFIPTLNECILNRIPKSINKSTGDSFSKNTKDDIDEEFYSLQYFMHLAQKGEMIVIDMLHTPENMIIERTNIWMELYSRRSMFYSKSLHGYLGYIKNQTAKYGVKGSRLKAIEDFINVLKKGNQLERLDSIWTELPINEFSMFKEHPKDNRIKVYECCGKLFQNTVKVGYVLPIMERIYDNYGARAIQAKNNEGIDWKAVSHAFRAGYQLLEIYKTGDLKYPLDCADYLKDIKLGKMHFQDDKIGEKLENILTEINDVLETSTLPNKVDVKKLDNFILDCYNKWSI